MHTQTSADTIDELIVAVYGSAPEPRQHYLLAQALQALVRLAKTEQMVEMRRSVKRASGGMAAAAESRRQTSVLLRKIGLREHIGQARRQFDQHDGAAPD
ncbi:hypothetical protein [Janthinobacterium sp.]|uniref:hypothetical protein n=1 Tax=Janthinobacterium sp. TaxID=1871054 RepID=UPI00293D28CC|nr:hypothetical protein [Janthinobacterium sp.]